VNAYMWYIVVMFVDSKVWLFPGKLWITISPVPPGKSGENPLPYIFILRWTNFRDHKYISVNLPVSWNLYACQTWICLFQRNIQMSVKRSRCWNRWEYVYVFGMEACVTWESNIMSTGRSMYQMEISSCNLHYVGMEILNVTSSDSHLFLW
jgi:hypothetical protein